MSGATKLGLAVGAVAASWAALPLMLLAAPFVWLLGRSRPTAPLPRKPLPSRPACKVCPDCDHAQRPDWTACWCCGANMDREVQPHLWV